MVALRDHCPVSALFKSSTQAIVHVDSVLGRRDSGNGFPRILNGFPSVFSSLPDYADFYNRSCLLEFVSISACEGSVSV